MLFVTDATPAVHALDKMLTAPFAEVRSATDLSKDPWGQLIQMLAKDRRKASPTTIASNLGWGREEIAEKDPPLAGMNPWLIDTMTVVDTGRRRLAGAENEGPGRLLLDSAEMLASFITDISPRRRPVLNIEPGGRPTFATATDDFYIHLTVDAPNRLTWYAFVGGAEHFDEGVAFDGRKLPPELARLFSL
jgi:hypothetical protein